MWCKCARVRLLPRVVAAGHTTHERALCHPLVMLQLGKAAAVGSGAWVLFKLVTRIARLPVRAHSWRLAGCRHASLVAGCMHACTRSCNRPQPT